VESADYRAYIANLRRIGCPEQTLRDIILADVNMLYTPRYAALASCQFAAKPAKELRVRITHRPSTRLSHEFWVREFVRAVVGTD
jgi:hypothetical protein